MKNTFKDIVKPVLVLGCICLAVTAALAFINSVTAPIIEEASRKEAEEAMTEVLSEADAFTEITVENAPETVTEIYCADNGEGYVFMLTAKGYGGDMDLICGVKQDGTIETCKTLSHSETSGLGSKTAEDAYRNQYIGKTSDTLDSVDSISGATISSTAYKGAIEDALEAFEMIKEAE